jgi:hypothetical protein
LWILLLDVLHTAGYNFSGRGFLKTHRTHPSIDLLSPVFQRALLAEGRVKYARHSFRVEDEYAAAVPVGDNDSARVRKPVRDYNYATRDKVLAPGTKSSDSPT